MLLARCVLPLTSDECAPMAAGTLMAPDASGRPRVLSTCSAHRLIMEQWRPTVQTVSKGIARLRPSAVMSNDEGLCAAVIQKKVRLCCSKITSSKRDLRVDVTVPEVVDGAASASQQQCAGPKQRQRAHVRWCARHRRQGDRPEARPRQQPRACVLRFLAQGCTRARGNVRLTIRV